jgi:hypothetical protein
LDSFKHFELRAMFLYILNLYRLEIVVSKGMKFIS